LSNSTVCDEQPPVLSLAELVGRVTTENLHGEVDFGQPKGGEAW
jgi:hypothetical protein